MPHTMSGAVRTAGWVVIAIVAIGVLCLALYAIWLGFPLLSPAAEPGPTARFIVADGGIDRTPPARPSPDGGLVSPSAVIGIPPTMLA
jgi:hypothetical protein